MMAVKSYFCAMVSQWYLVSAITTSYCLCVCYFHKIFYGISGQFSDRTVKDMQ